LAAIAIPNLLQANLRAKVARVHVDLRSVSIAIELYRLENDHYPPDSQFSTPGLMEFHPFLPRLIFLTTPVTHMSIVPEDVFAGPGIENFKPFGASYRIPYGAGPPIQPFTFDWAQKILPDGGFEDHQVWENISAQPQNVLWAMRSVGPDQIPTWLGNPEAKRYDPTNGVVSYGDIICTGPGRGLDGPP